jgi:hypothetical protein
MEEVRAIDVNDVEIKRGDIVKIVKQPRVDHSWLSVGNTLRVAYWEDRSLGGLPYIIVFLESKKGRKLCSLGVESKNLEVIKVY